MMALRNTETYRQYGEVNLKQNSEAQQAEA